jgi:hypothetical protein
MKLWLPISALVVLSAIELGAAALAYLQERGGELGLISEFLSTERVLTLILVYFMVYALPKQVWPWFTGTLDRYFQNQHAQKIEEFKARAQIEEQTVLILVKLLGVGVDVKEIMEKSYDKSCDIEASLERIAHIGSHSNDTKKEKDSN